MPQPKRQVEVTCEWCGRTFSLKPSLAKNRRWCNAQCRKEWGNANVKETVTCQQCGKEFETYKNHGRQFCSPSCSTTYRNLTDWNPSYHRDITGDKNPMYGRGDLISGEKNGMYGRTGEANPQYKNGRKERADGYIQILAPEGHPARSSPYPYVLEHRLVMEEHLGRFLDPEEVVHHLDGNPSNNDIDNLKLFENQSAHISLGHSSTS